MGLTYRGQVRVTHGPMSIYRSMGVTGAGSGMTDFVEGVEGVHCNAVLQVMHLAP